MRALAEGPLFDVDDRDRIFPTSTASTSRSSIPSSLIISPPAAGPSTRHPNIRRSDPDTYLAFPEESSEELGDLDVSRWCFFIGTRNYRGAVGLWWG